MDRPQDEQVPSDVSASMPGAESLTTPEARRAEALGGLSTATNLESEPASQFTIEPAVESPADATFEKVIAVSATPSAAQNVVQVAEAARPQSAHPVLYPGLTWLLGLMVGVVMLRYFVPQFAEEIQYSLTRGEQRAKYDVAGEHLTNTSLGDLSHAYQMVSQRVSPSVVHIGTMRVEDVRPVDQESEFRSLFGRMPPRELRGQGSGVIVDAGGYILTNYHVVHGASDVFVQLSDGRKLQAEVVGTDGPTDLALLKIEATGLTPAEWGDSEKIEVGSLVWAVGSPFGLDRSITSGILSAKHRRGIAHSIYQDFLQTDAAVNPGNSGGPLVDVQGRVIGINTAIIGDSFQGISFALPSSIARQIYLTMKDNKGHVPRGWLGVALEELTAERVAELKLADSNGIYIPQVIGDARSPSPASRAGMKQGDVLIRWDGQEIANGVAAFSNLVASTKIGQSVDIVVLRGGNEVPLTVIIGERPMDTN
jgi:S1-C subfamily serine protease